MSLFIEIFLIGVGLSMDAFAVSICKGLSMKKIKKERCFYYCTIFWRLSGFNAFYWMVFRKMVLKVILRVLIIGLLLFY